jgi:hypothetical protein
MKKLNKFVCRSTHFVVDKEGKLVFLSMCSDFGTWTGEKILLHHPKKLVRGGNIYKAIETLRNNY